MSVMSAGKKPKALARSLRAGNSRAGLRPGQFRDGEPGAAVSRSEERNVPARPGPVRRDCAVPARPGNAMPARPGSAMPARPRAARKSSPRPRLWVVPDAPGTAAAARSEPSGPGPATSGQATSGPAISGQATSGPATSGPGTFAGTALVPRPRVAPDDQIPARPGPPPSLPGRPRRAGAAVTPSRARVVRPASAPSRVPAPRVRRTRLTRRGRRLVWASAVLLVMAVITPVLLTLASGAQAANHGLPASSVRAGMRQVVVKPGQSLWSIALSAEPKADPRVVIQQILDFNALGSQVVVPGESLWVPRG